MRLNEYVEARDVLTAHCEGPHDQFQDLYVRHQREPRADVQVKKETVRPSH